MKMIKLAIIAGCFLGLSTTAYAHCGKCAGVKENHAHAKPAVTECAKKCVKAKDAKACAKKCAKKVQKKKK